jgi:multidrug resistance efflux pump
MESSFTPQLRRRLIIFCGLGLIIIAAGGTAAYFILAGSRIYIDTASIEAPLINLAPTTAGPLNAVYVNEGDSVVANQPVAEVGTEIITAEVAGLIVNVNNTIGANITSGESVVTEIDPTQLRVVGSIDENEGLAQIAVGDPVHFTVDAFGSKTFDGVVDEVAPTSNASDVVFSISDQREEQTFDVKARFDTNEYPQLKNGMSARMWVYQE